MSTVLDRIKSDYASKKMRSLMVPEWNIEIFYNPLTLSERKRIGAGHSDDDDVGLSVSLLMDKALDKNGARIFESDAETRAALLVECDASVFMRVVQEMGSTPSPAVAKNA